MCTLTRHTKEVEALLDYHKGIPRRREEVEANNQELFVDKHLTIQKKQHLEGGLIIRWILEDTDGYWSHIRHGVDKLYIVARR